MTESNSDLKKPYHFGGIKEFNLEDIESEVLNDSIYLDVFAGSDVRFKKNITPITGALDIVQSIEAVRFNYKCDEFQEYQFSSKAQIGFLAQNIEAQLPELVATDDKGYRHVNYSQMTPVLTQAIQELAAKVDSQEKTIEKLVDIIAQLTNPTTNPKA
jgi:hypothetical protein